MKKLFIIMLVASVIVSCVSVKVDNNKGHSPNHHLGCPGHHPISLLEILDTDMDSLYAVANKAYAESDFRKAAECYTELWKANRRNPVITWNTACMYGNVGEAELAGRFLAEAVKFEVGSVEMLENTKNFDSVKGDPVFDDYYAKAIETLTNKEKVRGFMSYIESPAKMQYRTMLPDDFDPAKDYPVLIFMHGYGGHPFNFAHYSEYLNSRDMIFIVPFAPYTFETAPYHIPNHSWSLPFGDEDEEDERASWVLSGEFIIKLAAEIKTTYKVKSLYLSGFSQGANMTLNTIVDQEHTFDGAISFGGWLNFDPEYELKQAVNPVPILIVHGESDKVISLEMGEKAYQQFTEAGYPVDIQTFEGAHSIPPQEFEKALDWILEKINK